MWRTLKIEDLLAISVLLYDVLVWGSIPKCYTDNYNWMVDKKCLEIVLIETDWYSARNYCAKRGGDLIEIRTPYLQASVTEHLKLYNGGRHGFWIGASDAESEGWWRWLHYPRGMGFSNWSPDQGANRHGFLFSVSGAVEDCAMIRTDDSYRWHDGPCDGLVNNLYYSFICQYDLTPMPSATTNTIRTSYKDVTTQSSKSTAQSTTLPTTKLTTTMRPKSEITSKIRSTMKLASVGTKSTPPNKPVSTHGQAVSKDIRTTTTEPIGVIIG